MGIKDDARDLLIELEEWQVKAEAASAAPASRAANFNTKSAAEGLKWTPTQINNAVAVLESSGYAATQKRTGTRPYDTHGVELTASGRLEAQRLLEAKAKIDAAKPEPLDPLDQAEHLLVLLTAKVRKEGRLGPFVPDDDLVTAIGSDASAIRKSVIPLMRDKGWLEKDTSPARMKMTIAGLEAAKQLTVPAEPPPVPAPTIVHSGGMLTLSTQVFLSHKGLDKPLVRRFQRVLKELGYNPWLDEEKMPAGTSLERALQEGMSESCAAIFFITESFKDEKWIGSEVEYAIARTREDKSFKVIAIVFGENSDNVPSLFKPFVHKAVQHEADAVYEIIRALPARVGALVDREARASAKPAETKKDDDKPPAAPVPVQQPDTRTLLGRSEPEWEGHRVIVAQAICVAREVTESVPLWAFRIVPSVPLKVRAADAAKLVQETTLYTQDHGQLPWYAEDKTKQMKAYVVGSSFVRWYEHEWRLYDDGTFFYEEAIAEDDPLARGPEQNQTGSSKRFLYHERACARVALAVGFARDLYRRLGHTGELGFVFRWTEMQDRALRFPNRYAPPEKYVCDESTIAERLNLTMSSFDSRDWEDPVTSMLDEVFRQFQAPGTPIKKILEKLK